MDEQLEKQKIELKVADSSDIPGTESSSECAPQILEKARDLEPVALVVAQPNASDKPTGRYALRKWPEAILTFVMVNSYLAVMMQFSMVLAHGGIGAWWELVKFNFLELVGFIFIGSSQLQSLMAQTGQIRVFFITTMIYWSMFLIYPIFILNDDGLAFGETRSLKRKWLDVIIAIASLILFLPMPLLSFWKYGGISRYLGFTKNCVYEERGLELNSTLKNESVSRCMPESLIVSVESVLSFCLLFYILSCCMWGPTRISLEEFGRVSCFSIILQLVMTVQSARRKDAFVSLHQGWDDFNINVITFLTLPSLFIELHRSHFQITPTFVLVFFVFLIGTVSSVLRLRSNLPKEKIVIWGGTIADRRKD